MFFRDPQFDHRLLILPGPVAHRVTPPPVGVDPRLLLLSPSVAASLGLRHDRDSAQLAAVLAGHQAVEGFTPYATVYAGHQFGHYVPQLGDGRALTIADLIAPDGTPLSIQLKGAGVTPFSRFGDGRAVMRSSIREYLCSEHMAALGIPTTRALSLVATHEGVRRETLEPGAIVARVAPSFLRFGHFEYFHHRGQPDVVRALADHVIDLHWPDLERESDPYVAFASRVIEKAAALMADWQAAGFCHGVMNTDNMSILGLTIDYGPFGFLDTYDPHHVCNHSDRSGRYAYAEQPKVGLWNLMALATAFSDLIPTGTLADLLDRYAPTFTARRDQLMATKLGLATSNPASAGLWPELLRAMHQGRADYTRTFSGLSSAIPENGGDAWLRNFSDHGWDMARAWLPRWREAGPDRTILASGNPRRVLRNWVAEYAIRAVEDEEDLATLSDVFEAVTHPFDDLPDARFDGPPPADMARLVVSCSS